MRLVSLPIFYSVFPDLLFRQLLLYIYLLPQVANYYTSAWALFNSIRHNTPNASPLPAQLSESYVLTNSQLPLPRNPTIHRPSFYLLHPDLHLSLSPLSNTHRLHPRIRLQRPLQGPHIHKGRTIPPPPLPNPLRLPPTH